MVGMEADQRACDGDWKPIYTGENCNVFMSLVRRGPVPYHPTDRASRDDPHR